MTLAPALDTTSLRGDSSAPATPLVFPKISSWTTTSAKTLGVLAGGGGGDTPTTGLRERGNDTSRSTGRSGRQNAATRRNMRREERVTVKGPVKEQQPDRMSHGGGGGGFGSSSWGGGGGLSRTVPAAPRAQHPTPPRPVHTGRDANLNGRCRSAISKPLRSAHGPQTPAPFSWVAGPGPPGARGPRARGWGPTGGSRASPRPRCRRCAASR